MQKSGCEQKSAAVQKPVAIRNVAVMQRTPQVLKPPSVHGSFVSQKSDGFQKSSAQKGWLQKSCGSLQEPQCGLQIRCRVTKDCEPCGFCHRSRLAGFVERLDTALLRVFPPAHDCCPRVRQHDTCGCGAEPAGYVPLLPVPEPWSNPDFDDNPFRDDTLPLPPPSPPAREARLPLHPPANRTAVTEDRSNEVRTVAFYAEPVSIEPQRQ